MSRAAASGTYFAAQEFPRPRLVTGRAGDGHSVRCGAYGAIAVRARRHSEVLPEVAVERCLASIPDANGDGFYLVALSDQFGGSFHPQLRQVRLERCAGEPMENGTEVRRVSIQREADLPGRDAIRIMSPKPFGDPVHERAIFRRFARRALTVRHARTNYRRRAIGEWGASECAACL